MPAESLLAAIQGGIETANTDGGMPPVADDNTGGDDAAHLEPIEPVEPVTDDGDAVDGGTEPVDTEGGDGTDPAAEPETDDVDTDADEAGADGSDPAATAGGKPGDKKGGDGASDDGKPKELTPEQLLEAPIDGRLKEATKERIRGLVSMAKTVTAERDQARSQAQELIEVITDTGASPEQYGQALSYLQMVNSNEPAQLEKAYEFMQGELQALGKLLGKVVPGTDPLADHEDLREAVLNGSMSEQHAAELAAARSARALQTQQSQRRTQQTNQETARSQAIQKGRADLNALEVRLKKSDPQFAAKAEILIPAMQEAIAKADPSTWATIWETAYKKLNIPAPRANPKPRPGIPNQQPLRAKNPAGGEQRTAGSLGDAIKLGIAAAGGG